MYIKIHMLNIGDADAIIVQLNNSGLNLTLLIDGGKNNDHADRIINYFNKIQTKPSIVICTHIDQDHIGGLPTILREYQHDITSIWTHLPEKHYKQDSFKKVLLERAGINEKLRPILASVEDHEKFLDVARQLGLYDKIIEPFPLDDVRNTYLLSFCSLWGIEILGPSLGFYELLLPDILKEYDGLLSESRILKASSSPCLLIGQNGKDTPVNESSLIFQISANGFRYLFTGDAGLRAFSQIEDRLSSIYWLKVPHHGSKINLNAQIIGKLQPNISFISADGINGHPDINLIECLKKHGSNPVLCTGIEDKDLVL